MSNRRKAHLDALERRLTGPKRIALFGHRAVGKTTLLAMFYRQASTGQVPGHPPGGGRPAQRRVPGREDRADRVGRAAGRHPGRDRAEAPALSRSRAVRPDRQGLPGGARHPRHRRADPGLLRRLRRRPPLPRPRGLDPPGRPPTPPAGGREPSGALHRPLRRRHRRPSRGPAADQVRPRPGPRRGRPRARRGRAAGRGPLRDDPARPGPARPPRRHLRRQRLRPGLDRRPSARRAPPARPRRAARLARRPARGDRPRAARMALGPRPRRPAPPGPLRLGLREALSPLRPRGATSAGGSPRGGAGSSAEGWPELDPRRPA